MNISIIIPYRDRKRNLEITLKLFEQQEKFSGQFELLIINLGSKTSISDILTQHSKEIYVNYHGIFSRGYACNVGAKQAKFDIIWFIDADCIPHPKLLYLLETNFDIIKPNFAINCPVIFLNQNETNKIILKKTYTYDNFLSYKNNKNIWLKPHIDGTSQICMHKKTYIDLGGIDERFIGHGYEDLLLHDQIADLNPDYWSRFPDKAEVKWSIERNLILTHLFHGHRNYRRPYMSKYRDNLKLYKTLISQNIKKNNEGKEWGLLI